MLRTEIITIGNVFKNRDEQAESDHAYLEKMISDGWEIVTANTMIFRGDLVWCVMVRRADVPKTAPEPVEKTSTRKRSSKKATK